MGGMSEAMQVDVVGDILAWPLYTAAVAPSRLPLMCRIANTISEDRRENMTTAGLAGSPDTWT